MKKILIVDDDPNIVMSLEYVLRRKKFDVFIARNSSEALDAIGKHLPDLILLNSMRPEINGYDICAYVKTTPDLKHIKVIFLGAKGKNSDTEKGLEIGVEMYMTKPFSNKELIENIDGLLN